MSYVNRLQTFHTTDFTAFKQAVIRIRFNKSSDQSLHVSLCSHMHCSPGWARCLIEFWGEESKWNMRPPQPPKLYPHFSALSSPPHYSWAEAVFHFIAVLLVHIPLAHLWRFLSHVQVLFRKVASFENQLGKLVHSHDKAATFCKICRALERQAQFCSII